MAVVSVAIVLSFHLKREPTDVELRLAKPLGAIFWTLSVAALCAGVGNYISEHPSESDGGPPEGNDRSQGLP